MAHEKQDDVGDVPSSVLREPLVRQVGLNARQLSAAGLSSPGRIGSTCQHKRKSRLLSPASPPSSAPGLNAVQYLAELQGGQHSISTAIAHSCAQRQGKLVQHLKQELLYRDMSAVCKARLAQQQQLSQQQLAAGQQQLLCRQIASSTAAQAQLFGLVLVLTEQLSTAERQHEASMQTQQRLQQDILKLKRSLAAAQQRKESAESKLKAMKQESKALAVALKTVASMLVDKSEQKAELQCSAEMVQQQGAPKLPASVRPLLQQCVAAQQLLLACEQQPPTPSGDSNCRHSAQGDAGVQAAVLELEDMPGRSDSRGTFDQVLSLESVGSVQAGRDLYSPDTASSINAGAQHQQSGSADGKPDTLQSPSCSSSASNCGSAVSTSGTARGSAQDQQHKGPCSSLGDSEGTSGNRQVVSSQRAQACSSRRASAGSADSKGADRERPRWR